VEIGIVDDEDSPIANRDYKIICSNGEIKTGKTDSDGNLKVEGIQPGSCIVQYNLRNKE